MRLPTNIRYQLTTIGGLSDEAIKLAETALVLASIERPGTTITPYLRHLERLVTEVRAYTKKRNNLEQKVAALRQILAKRYGYKAADETPEDLENTNLMHVIDRRCGMPIALGIIYIYTARSQGWIVSGLDFPARFLVRLENKGERIIIDPYNDGHIVTPKIMRNMIKATHGRHAEIRPGHYQALSNRSILVRLQNHMKFHFIRAGRLEEALHSIETMLLFNPEEATLWREAGLLNARLDNVQEAVSALEEYLHLNKKDSAQYRTTIFLQELRNKLL